VATLGARSSERSRRGMGWAAFLLVSVAVAAGVGYGVTQLVLPSQRSAHETAPRQLSPEPPKDIWRSSLGH
jgi:hypothetical protein